MKYLCITILQIIFICTFSTLAQRQWIQQNSGTTAHLRAVDFVDEHIGFAVGHDVLLKTTDGGINWMNWSSVSGTFYAIDFLDENFGFIINNSGIGGANEIWKTTDGGQNWAIKPVGYQMWGVSFADYRRGMIATSGGTATLGRVVLKTTDGGESWIEQHIPGTNSLLSDVFFRNNMAIAVSWETEIARTTDSGITWDVVNVRDQYNYELGDFQAVHWKDENFITVTGDYGIVHSTDGGDSWYLSNIEIDDVFGVYCVSSTECTGVAYDGIIIHTTNMGQTWEYDNSGTTTPFLYDVHFTDCGIGVAVGLFGIIVRTVEDTTPPEIIIGTQMLTLWPPNHKYEAIHLDDFDIEVVDGCDDNVGFDDLLITSVSSDEEENGKGDGNTVDDVVLVDCQEVELRKERSGNGNGRVYSINVAVTDNSGNTARATCYVTVPHSKKKDAIDDGVAYSIDGCVGNGARRDYAGNYEKENTETPNDLHLAQNYPNPFNPSTLITYHIPESGFVTLIVYDVIGKEVAILVSENKGQGSYSVTFDASALPSGIYIYQLKVNSFMETKKMLLMK
jgi:photosystem II stability/assembly factor-like uncharacterized protein